MMALEETTGEIIEGLHRMKLLPRIIGDVSEVLVRADLVKFAKHKPEIGEHDASLKSVYDVVERTKAAPSPSGQPLSPSAPGQPTPSTPGQSRPPATGRSPKPAADKEGAHVGA
jgi:hypothetical protein